jgi:heat shock protein HslJ
VTIGHGVLDIGKPIGQGSGCTGTPGGPPPDIAKFDNVMSSDHLTWHRTGETLRLANAHGQSIELHAVGAALSVTDQRWSLERIVGPHSYGHEGNYQAARLLISNGIVDASDLCNDLTGSAAVTDTTITFTDMRATDRSCVDQALTRVADVIDHVLSGTTDYTIRGNELIINGHAHGLLIYTPGR